MSQTNASLIPKLVTSDVASAQ